MLLADFLGKMNLHMEMRYHSKHHQERLLKKRPKVLFLAAVYAFSMICIASICVFTVQAEEFPVILSMEPSDTYSKVDIVDNDELFEFYVEKSFLGSAVENMAEAESEQKFRKVAPRLSGLNAQIAQILKERISDVAAGQVSSTVFFLSVDELGLSETAWTAADLGVADIVVNNAISEEAVTAASQLLGISLDSIISNLLVECPYDLYWYDKTIGVNMTGLRFSASYVDGEWTLRPVDGLTCYFAVSEDYAIGQYETDTSIGSTVSHAVETAQNIVAANAGLNDGEKLDAYRKMICGLTSYNQNAADDPDISYGNTWQLIWVFDEEPDTKVVCEGYAKAFQYLCMMSTFQSETLESRIVTGTMDSGTGAENHMWNVVTMDDGRNYLVDVTNCDTGTIGAPDRLFLVEQTEGDSTWYRIDLDTGNSISYIYDEDTVELYAEQELALSSQPYSPQTGELIVSDNILPAGTVVIGEEAFANNAFESVQLPFGVQRIDARAFANCESLQMIYIPESVSDIADDAFEGCTELVIAGTSGSLALQYAEEKGISYMVLPASTG